MFHLSRTEYLIFQKILKLEYSFPEKFPDTAKRLVENLLVRLDRSELISTERSIK